MSDSNLAMIYITMNDVFESVLQSNFRYKKDNWLKNNGTNVDAEFSTGRIRRITERNAIRQWFQPQVKIENSSLRTDMEGLDRTTIGSWIIQEILNDENPSTKIFSICFKRDMSTKSLEILQNIFYGINEELNRVYDDNGTCFSLCFISNGTSIIFNRNEGKNLLPLTWLTYTKETNSLVELLDESLQNKEESERVLGEKMLGYLALPIKIADLITDYLDEQEKESFDLIVRDLSFPIQVSVGHLFQCNIITNTLYPLKINDRIIIKPLVARTLSGVYKIEAIGDLSNESMIEYSEVRNKKLLEMNQLLKSLD